MMHNGMTPFKHSQNVAVLKIMCTLRNIEGEKHITGSVNRNLACAIFPHNSLVTGVFFFFHFTPLLILGQNIIGMCSLKLLCVSFCSRNMMWLHPRRCKLHALILCICMVM